MRAASLAFLVAIAPGFAGALTISEGPDFGDTLATRTLLPAQTDRIQGTVYFDGFPENSAFWDTDFVAFTDLQPGATFTVTAVDSSAAFAFPLSITDAAGVLVQQTTIPGSNPGGPPIVLTSGVVPGSGELVFRISSSDFYSDYLLQLDAPRVVPEAGAALLLAFAVAGMRSVSRAS